MKLKDYSSALLRVLQANTSDFSALSELQEQVLEVQKQVSQSLIKASSDKMAHERERRETAQSELEDLRAELAEERLERKTLESKLNVALAELEKEGLERQAIESKLKDVLTKLENEELERAAAEFKLNDVLSELQREREQRETVEKRVSDLLLQKHAAHHGACWQYEMDGHWHPFSPEGNDQMHQAYLAYIADMHCFSAKIVAGGVERIVNFKEMTQTHATTWKIRTIRIVMGVPPQWLSTPTALLTQRDDLASFYVEVTDAGILEWVARILRSTGHASDVSTVCSHMKKATVKSVHQIENCQLWHRYQARLATMREDQAKYSVSVWPADLDLDGVEDSTMALSQPHLNCGEPLACDVDEKILLHGTSWRNANSIVMHGFDNRICMRGMYGDGVYFAGAACKSHQYSCGVHSGKASTTCKCERTLIIARVALGDAFHASSTQYGARRPPNRPGARGMHGSVVVNPGPIIGHHSPVQVHQEFVIFNGEQAYPAFVVQYLP